MPKKPPKKRSEADKICAGTLALWRDRRDSLRTKVQEHTDAQWVWLWRTRLTVLDYLIQRYADDGVSALTRCVASRSEALGGPRAPYPFQEPTSPYDRAPSSSPPMIGVGKKDAIQSRLASLRCANAARHAEAEETAKHLRELREVSPAPYEPDKLMIAEALQQSNEREFKELRKNITFDLGMTQLVEEELDEVTIRLILKEHGIEQDESG